MLMIKTETPSQIEKLYSKGKITLKEMSGYFIVSMSVTLIANGGIIILLTTFLKK